MARISILEILTILSAFTISWSNAFSIPSNKPTFVTQSDAIKSSSGEENNSNRRKFLSQSAAVALATLTANKLTPQVGGEAEAVGPVKIPLKNPKYFATICPKDKPIPGEKAMKGMKGLCVTVTADLSERSPKVSRVEIKRFKMRPDKMRPDV